MLDNAYATQQISLGIPEIERLTYRSSSEIETLAWRVGWSGVSMQHFKVNLSSALNICLLSEAQRHGVDKQAFFDSLPGLRAEALMVLGSIPSSWYFDGPVGDQIDFFASLSDYPDAQRRCVARLLGISSTPAIREARFFSENDVERIFHNRSDCIQSSRLPICSIDPHNLAARVKSVCTGSLFTARNASKD